MKGIEEKSVGNGQKLVTAFPIDKSSEGSLGDSAQARHGKKMGGGTHDLSASLGGATAPGQAARKRSRLD